MSAEIRPESAPLTQFTSVLPHVANRVTHSTCPYCGVGCGIKTKAQSGKNPSLQLLPDGLHPANLGRLCVKGRALGQTLHPEGRLHQPQVDGRRVAWPVAIDSVASRLNNIIAEHGPASVAMYLSGQLLTEDYYVANKLLKGFIGSPHLDTNSRLCMASAVAGYKRAFGEDVVPGCYEDVEQADLVVLVGSNLAWAHPVLFQRLQAARASDPTKKLVVIDPRRTLTAEQADLHLPLKSGTDVALWVGLLDYLAKSGQLDKAYLANFCEGQADTLHEASHWPNVEALIAGLAAHCELAPAALSQFFHWFAATAKTVTVFSQGVNQAVDGTDRVNAIINVHLATGRIGKPGACPFSITGQPNAMGGREVGALANQLAGHLRFAHDPTLLAAEDPSAEWRALQQFWQAPHLVSQGGYSATELFAAIGRQEIKAVWIMATNPVVSMPEADMVKAALAQCDLVIVSDIYQDTDTVALADIVLPACGFAEKDGTVTNSERCISRQRALVAPVGEARPDWQIICAVAQAMGFAHGFNYQSPAEIFNEHAMLSTLCNNGQRAFDLGALSRLSDDDYAQLAPVRWPQRTLQLEPHRLAQERQSQRRCSKRLFSDGRFYTASQKAQLIPLPALGVTPRPTEILSTADAMPVFWLNSGRLRDQWHTMTRTGKVATLMQHQSEPFIAMHPADAARLQILTGDWLALHNRLGRYIARVQLTDAQRLGELFVPMHWSSVYASDARCDVLYANRIDPQSKQPALKQTLVQVEKLPVSGMVRLFCQRDDLLSALSPFGTATVLVVHANLIEYRLVLSEANASLAHSKALLQAFLQEQFAPTQGNVAVGSLPRAEEQADWYLILHKNNALQAVCYGQKTETPIAATWLERCFASDLTEAQLAALCQAEAPKGIDCSALICSCFQVRQSAIAAAIGAGANTVKALGSRLRCGTGCGSCLPEITQLIQLVE